MDTFEECICDDSNEIINFEKPQKKKPIYTFKQFLEDNLGDIINCPITSCTMYCPVVASDGFIYESSQLIQHKKHTYGTVKSPKTREPLSDIYFPIPLIKQLITYADKYDLRVSEDKFIMSNSFEDSFNDLCEALKNKHYHEIFNHKDFILDHMDVNGKSFCQIMFEYTKENSKAASEMLIHILNNSKNINFFLSHYKWNILHIICRFSSNVVVLNHTINILTKSLNLDINTLNIIDYDANTPIDYAFIQDKFDVADCMLSHIKLNPTPNVILKLIRICKNVNFVIELLSKVIDLNQTQTTISFLFEAIKNHKLEITKYLIEHGADISIKDSGNRNAVHYACQFGSPQIALMILEKYQNFEEEVANGWKPIHIASYYNKKEVIEFLLYQFVTVNTPITDFNGNKENYLPINLIELNQNLKNADKDELINMMVQFMPI